MFEYRGVFERGIGPQLRFVVLNLCGGVGQGLFQISLVHANAGGLDLGQSLLPFVQQLEGLGRGKEPFHVSSLIFCN